MMKILNSCRGTLVALPGRALLLLLGFSAFVLLPACQKKSETTLELRSDQVAGLKEYSQKVGVDPETLYSFQKSLKTLKNTDGSSSLVCLEKLQDNEAARKEFIECLSLRGLSGLQKDFLEELVGIRLARIHIVHDREASRTLRLLNWIFDISVEQYSLSNPKSYWLEKNAEGKWKFTDNEQKNQDDYDFQEGDLVLSVSPTELSTLIPQYSYPQRRLTHSKIFRGQRGHRKPHFVEAEFEEGVRLKYRDIHREKDRYYETITLRYQDPSLSIAQLMALRRYAADFAASKKGVPYGFTTDIKDGFACHFLTGLSYAEAEVNYDVKASKRKEQSFDDLKNVLTEGYSPMREGLSRSYSAKFGMADSIKEYPTAGDFLTSDKFEAVAVFINPNHVKKFSDLYAVAETFVDALDRGSEISITDKEKKDIEPMLRDRYKLSELIGMARKLKRHSIFREQMSAENVSVERVDEMTVQQLKDVLDRLDEERRVLIRAARNEIGLNILPNAFGRAIDLDKKEKTGIETQIKMGDFLLRVQKIREKSVEEYNEYVHSQSTDDPHLKVHLKSLQEYLAELVVKMGERKYEITKIRDEEFEQLRKLTVEVDFRLIDKLSDHKEIDKMLNRVIVGFDETDFKQLDLFIEKLEFEDFKDIINYTDSETYTTVYMPSRGVVDPNWKPNTYKNPTRFVRDLPVMGKVVDKVQGLIDSKNLDIGELEELVGLLRVYSRFLLSVPSLKKKLVEFDDKQEELQRIIKNTPYIASALSNETLIEFGLYKTMASKVVDKMNEFQSEKAGIRMLWQTPPWDQRSLIDLIFRGVPVLRYVPQ